MAFFKMLTISAAIDLVLLLPVSGAAAVRQARINDLGLDGRSQFTLTAEVCPLCVGHSADHVDPSLQPIHYFEDKRKIRTVPRTLEGKGSAGELGLAGVGMIRVPGPKGGIGTGFLVSPCHVLTNFHVAFAADPKHPSAAVKVDFYYGQGRDDGYAAHIRASPVDHPELGVHGWGKQDPFDLSDDWALLRLESCIGARLGYMILLPAIVPDGAMGDTYEIAGILKNPTVNGPNY